MKATGMVRRLYHLGRVCLPKELRRKLRMNEEDPIEVYVEGDSIILKKYDAAGDMEQLMDNLEKNIRLMDTMIPDAKIKKLLAKVKDMRRILHEN